MDAQFLAEFRALPIRRRNALEAGLSELLTRVAGPITIRGARDQFTSVNRAAKDGQAQLVKGPAGEETVILSVRDLATMIQAAAASLTLGDALSISHFRPAGGTLDHHEEPAADNVFDLEAFDFEASDT